MNQYSGLSCTELLAIGKPETDLEKALYAALKDSIKKVRFIAADIVLPEIVNATAWREWCAYRTEKRKPIGARAAKEQITLLSMYSKGIQADMIGNSIRNDYQGLFPPKGANYGQAGTSNAGHQGSDNSAAGRVRAAIARDRAERATTQGAAGMAVADDGLHVRPQMGEQLRSGGGPGPGVGIMLEGDFSRSD